MQVYLCGSRTVGDKWVFVQEKDQSGPLPQMMADGPLAHDLAGLFHEIGREGGAVEWYRTVHGKPPSTPTVCVPIPQPLTVYPNDPGRETLQLIVKRSTKVTRYDETYRTLSSTLHLRLLFTNTLSIRRPSPTSRLATAQQC